MSRNDVLRSASPLALSIALVLHVLTAQAQQVQELPAIDVDGQGGAVTPAPPPAVAPAAATSAPTISPPPIVQTYQLPVMVDSITAQQIAESINIIDPEDAVKY